MHLSFLLFHNSASKASFEQWTHSACIVCQGECARWCLRKRGKPEAAKSQYGYLGMQYISPACKCEHLTFSLVFGLSQPKQSHNFQACLVDNIPSLHGHFEVFSRDSNSPTQHWQGQIPGRDAHQTKQSSPRFAHCFAFVHLHLRISSAKMVGLGQRPYFACCHISPGPQTSCCITVFWSQLEKPLCEHGPTHTGLWDVLGNMYLNYQTILLQSGAFTVFMHYWLTGFAHLSRSWNVDKTCQNNAKHMKLMGCLRSAFLSFSAEVAAWGSFWASGPSLAKQISIIILARLGKHHCK